jgi:hypothetical protein
LFAGGVGGIGERLTADPTGENEPTPDERLPPRETRTKLRRTAKRTPHLNWICDTPEIQPGDATLEPQPTNADQNLPTASGPACLKVLSHTFSLREHFQAGGDAGSTGRVELPATPDSPKESNSTNFVFVRSGANEPAEEAAGLTGAGG